MVWVRFDDDFPQHPKVIGLSDGAFRALVTATCYSSHYLTDGVVPKAMVPTEVGVELSLAGILEENGTTWKIHDFLDYNPSRDEVLEVHAAKVRAGRIGAAKRWHNSTPIADAIAERKQNDSPYPDLSTEVDFSSKGQVGSQLTLVPPPTFEDFWKVYPRHDDRIAAGTKFKAALAKVKDPWEIVRGAERYRDDPNREQGFTKLAKTWLNQGSWENGPLPERNGSKPERKSMLWKGDT